MKHIKSFEQLNEGKIAVLGSARNSDISKWLESHPAIAEWMSSFVRTGDAKKDYLKWLKDKNALESKAQSDASARKQLEDMGFRSETVDSPSFGKKTFFKMDFPDRVMFAELFQYVHDR